MFPIYIAMIGSGGGEFEWGLGSGVDGDRLVIIVQGDDVVGGSQKV